MSQPKEDEIDLRELFGTIWRHKWFIFWVTFVVTLLVVVIAYRMPKYYKTTTVIEVKAKSNSKQGFSLGVEPRPFISGDKNSSRLGKLLMSSILPQVNKDYSEKNCCTKCK